MTVININEFKDRLSVEESSESPTGHPTPDLIQFCNHFKGCMVMYADPEAVKRYLDAHLDWFVRCAHPMQVTPIDDNGYGLTIGRFGALGFELEPKLGLKLLPQQQGVYTIETIPVPDYTPVGYTVDFQAVLELMEQHPLSPAASHELPETTHVDWQLDLRVMVRFPRFIQELPQGVIQKTGDRLLRGIVRQVSHRLTAKVQKDFHASLGIPFPVVPQSNRFLRWPSKASANG